MKRAVWVVGGLLLGVGLLWYSLRSVAIEAAIVQIAGANGGYMLLALASSAIFGAVKTRRWCVLLRPLASVRFTDLHGPVYAGTAANLAISHVGEIVRARMVNRTHGVATSTVLASIGLERVLDLAVILLLLGGLMLVGSAQFGPTVARAAEITAALVFVAALGVTTVILWPTRWAGGLARATSWMRPAHGEWIRRQFEGLVGGFKVIASPSLAARALLLSMLQWGVIAAAIWCCMKSVDIDLNAIAAIAVLALMVVGLTLPTAPVYLGTTQAAFTVVLGLFGVAADAAFAASVIYTGCVVFPMFVVGLLCLLRGRREVAAPRSIQSPETHAGRVG